MISLDRDFNYAFEFFGARAAILAQFIFVRGMHRIDVGLDDDMLVF